MMHKDMEICGRDISQMDELDWVPIEQATDTEPFLYVTRGTRLWAIIPFLYSCWFLFMCVLIMFVAKEGDYNKDDIPPLIGVFYSCPVAVFRI